MREANQAGSLQPTTLVSYDAEIADVFDCRDEEALKAEGMDAAALADTTWRDQMKATGEGEGAELCPALDGEGLSCAAGQKLRARCNRDRSQSRTLGLGRLTAVASHSDR